MQKTVLVTGGSRGIGRSIVKAVVADGWQVISVSRSEQSVDGVASFACELGDLGAIPGLVKEIEQAHGPISALVANAGMTSDMLLLRADTTAIEQTIGTNLTSSIVLAREVLRSMLKNRWGRIIFMGSVVAAAGSGGQVAYAASKAGLVGAARSLAREVGARGITVNVVAPGFIETDMTSQLPLSAKEKVLEVTPLGRTGTPDDVAGAVSFLLSDEASFVTGAVLPVDGGLGMGH